MKSYVATVLKARWLALFALMLFSTLAPAQPGPGGPGGPGGPMMGRRMARMHDEGRMGFLNPQWLLKAETQQKLALKPDQVEKIKKLDYDTKKETIQLDAQLRQAELDMRQLMEQDQPDRGKVLAQVETVGKLRVERQKLEVGASLDLRSILTADQLKKAKELKQERRAEMREKMGQRGQRGQGQPGGPPMAPPPNPNTPPPAPENAPDAAPADAAPAPEQ